MAATHTDQKSWLDIAPYQELLGLKRNDLGEGLSEAQLPYRRELTNRRGDIHGGVISALFDFAMTWCVRAGRPEIASVSTISMTVNYLEPGRGDLTVRGKLRKRGKSIASAEAEITNAEGAVVAVAIGSFRMIAARE